METITLDKDIKVITKTATSFPEGVVEAHKALHSLVDTGENRRFFGISHPVSEDIVYKAGVEELHEGEAERLGCESFVIKSGTYTAKTIYNFTSSENGIGEAFEELLENSDIDPEGYCLEWYITEKDVRCMVPLNST